jgi:hypothetical protein
VSLEEHTHTHTHIHTHTHHGKQPCEDKGRNWSDTVSSKGKGKIVEIIKIHEERQGSIPYRFHQEHGPLFQIHYLQNCNSIFLFVVLRQLAYGP